MADHPDNEIIDRLLALDEACTVELRCRAAATIARLLADVDDYRDHGCHLHDANADLHTQIEQIGAWLAEIGYPLDWSTTLAAPEALHRVIEDAWMQRSPNAWPDDIQQLVATEGGWRPATRDPGDNEDETYARRYAATHPDHAHYQRYPDGSWTLIADDGHRLDWGPR